MTTPEKHFTYYKSGLKISITPRTVYGWFTLGLWMVALGPIIWGFAMLMEQTPTSGQTAVYVVGLLGATIVWTVAMVRWMKARSEVVDIDELLEIKREREAAQRKGRR